MQKIKLMTDSTSDIDPELEQSLRIQLLCFPVTVDGVGQINFPYLYAKKRPQQAFATRKRFSFCCTLLHPRFLQAFSFQQLDPTKHWFDVTISHASLQLGFKNYLFTLFPVLHRPHSSRPWMLLKYTNPLKYYWIKYTKRFDTICVPLFS